MCFTLCSAWPDSAFSFFFLLVSPKYLACLGRIVLLKMKKVHQTGSLWDQKNAFKTPGETGWYYMRTWAHTQWNKTIHGISEQMVSDAPFLSFLFFLLLQFVKVTLGLDRKENMYSSLSVYLFNMAIKMRSRIHHLLMSHFSHHWWLFLKLTQPQCFALNCHNRSSLT